MRKWIMCALLCLVLSALCLSALSEDLPSVTWQGHALTPRYYALSYNSFVHVRVSCGAIPLSALTRGMQEFVLPGADGGKDVAAYGIMVLGEYVYGTPEWETEFFDIVFKTGQKSGDLQVRLGADSPVLSVPLIDENRDLAAFQTESGAYVMSFYHKGDPERLWSGYESAFAGQDVTLYVEDSIDQTGVFYDLAPLLKRVSFASLRLFTSAQVGESYDAACVKELGLFNRVLNALPVFPNAKKLTLCKNAVFPDGMTAAFPALEEMTLLLLAPYAGWDLVEQNERPVQVIPSLKELRVSLSFGDVPTDDPDFRVWLAAERMAAQDLQVNGVPAEKYDLTEGLGDEKLEELRRAADDRIIMNLYGLLGQDVPWQEEVRPERMVAAVVDRYGRLRAVSTDRKTDDDFAGPLSGHLAGSLEAADAVAIVYPVLREAGKYGGSFIAYSCETRLAVIDWRNGQVLWDQTVITNQPPASMKLGSGENAGYFDVPRALQALGDALK